MPQHPDRTTAALQQQEYRRWLDTPLTRALFKSMKDRAVELSLTAAKNSVRTGLENATEHNQLVRAAEILKLIDIYGNATSYPFANDTINTAGTPD